MARKKPGPKKLPKDQLKPERPVVSVRFDPAIYAEIKAEADARGVTITDVIHGCWLNSKRTPAVIEVVQYIEHHPDRRAAAWQELERKATEENLRRLGYTRLTGPGGAVWAEPSALIPATIVKALTEPKE